MADVIADILVVIGLIVMTVGVLGIYRMPNVYLQMHGSSKSVFLGVIGFVVASFMDGNGAVISKGVLVIAFLLLTTPVSTHMIARSASLGETARSRRD